MSHLPKITSGQSWWCINGCGECKPKESLFEYSRTEHSNGDIESKSQRVFVSHCCHTDLMLWDEGKQDFVEWSYSGGTHMDEQPREFGTILASMCSEITMKE